MRSIVMFKKMSSEKEDFNFFIKNIKTSVSSFVTFKIIFSNKGEFSFRWKNVLWDIYLDIVMV